MKKIYLVLFFQIVFVIQGFGQWEECNSFWVGNVQCLSVYNNNIYAGTDRGLSLSTDYGLNWDWLSKNNDLRHFRVTTIAYKDKYIFVGTGGGVFLSTDNGDSWVAKNTGLNNLSVKSLTTSKNNIIAGTDQGIYISSDNGFNWIEVNNNLSVQSIIVNGNYIFVGTGGEGVFLSTDNGTTWDEKNTGISDKNIYSLVSSEDNIYAGSVKEIFRSTDNGNSWTNTGLNADTGIWIKALKVFGNSIFACNGNCLYISTNNGNSWIKCNAQIPVSNGSYIADCAIINDYFIAGASQYQLNKPPEGVFRARISDLIDALKPEIPEIEWAKCYGGSKSDSAVSIQQTNDGGYIVSGYSHSNDGDVSGNHGDADFWIIRLNLQGNVLWEKSLGGSGSEWTHASVNQTIDGGYIVAGTSESSDSDVSENKGYCDYWIVKLNPEGTIQWEKSYGGSAPDILLSLKQTIDGGYIAAGSSYSNDGDVSGNHGDADFWIVKLNSQGNLQWQKSLGGSYPEQAATIEQTSDGGYIVAGYSESKDGDLSTNNGSYDYWIVKLNPEGTIQWQKSYGGSNLEAVVSIQETIDGGYVAAGFSNSYDGNVTANHGKYDYWIVKLNSEGTIQWQKSLGGSGNDLASSIQQTRDGGYIVAGYSESKDGDLSTNNGSYDYWIVKLNPEGTIQWQKSMGGNKSDAASSILQTKDGGFITAGWSESNDGYIYGNHGNYDYWIVKFKLQGNTKTPSPPQNLKLQAYKDGCVLAWDASETEGVKYSLYRSEIQGQYPNENALFNEQAFQSWEDLDLEEGKTYYYVARAVLDGVESENSNEVEFKNEPFEGPKNLTIVDLDAEQKTIQLEWDEVDGSDFTYSIYRVSHTSDGDYTNTLPIKENIHGNGFIDDDIEYGIKYFYVVRAKDIDGIYSKISNEVSTIIQDPIKVAELNSWIDKILVQCEQLEKLNDSYDKLNVLQKPFYDFLEETYYKNTKGYDCSLIKELMNKWKVETPLNINTSINVLERANQFFYFLIVSYGIVNDGVTNGYGLKNVSAEMTQAMADFIKDFISALFAYQSYIEINGNDMNFEVSVSDFVSIIYKELLVFEKYLGMPYPNLFFNVENFDPANPLAYKNLQKNLIKESPKMIIDAITPYWKSHDLDYYFINNQNSITSSYNNIINSSFSGNISDSKQKILSNLRTLNDIGDGFMAQKYWKDVLFFLVNLSEPILQVIGNNGCVFCLQADFLMRTAVLTSDMILWIQRRDFLFYGYTAPYHLGQQRYLPEMTKEALTSAFHPDQLEGIIQKDKKSDVALGDVSVNISASGLLNNEIIESDTLLMHQIIANIDTDIDYFTNNFDNIKESGEKACEEIKNLRLPVLGITADLMLTDTNFYATVVDLQTDIEMLRAYRRIVTSAIIFYRADATTERADTIRKYIDLYLNNFPKVVSKTEAFMSENSDKIEYPVFDIVSVSSEESGADQYDITIKLKNFGADLINGKIKISYLCDNVEYITSDTIAMSNVSSLSEIEILSKAMLQSSTGIVTITAEYLFDESSRYSIAEINIPITPVNVEEKGNHYLVENILNISPNPATTHIEIQATGAGGQESGIKDKKIEIYNLLGVQVLEIDNIFESTRRIDVSGLPPGVYILRIDGVSRMFAKE